MAEIEATGFRASAFERPRATPRTLRRIPPRRISLPRARRQR